MMAVGVARPRAQGQAMTSTATAASTALPASPPMPNQRPKVRAAMPSTTGTNTPAMRSARCWMGALVAWASSTRRTICARAVPAPTRVASTTRWPCWLTVAPNTGSPGPRSTGADSPVSMLSSTEEDPSTTRPSVGMRSPGRTTIRSPGRTAAMGTLTSAPSRRRRASLAPNSSRRATAREARPLARASKKRPRRMKVMMTAAVSK